jgi:hypothetical protein
MEEDLMQKTLKRTLFWVPRILSILYILFLGLFSLDVFGMGAGFWVTLAGFLIHNIPALILLGALILAWRWEWIGAVVFIGAGVLYLVVSWGKFDWIAPLVISGTAILVGTLFLIGWIDRKGIRAT